VVLKQDQGWSCSRTGDAWGWSCYRTTEFEDLGEAYQVGGWLPGGAFALCDQAAADQRGGRGDDVAFARSCAG
jgi:hypothetical protein